MGKRSPNLDANTIREINRLASDGMTAIEIAARLGVDRKTIYRHVTVQFAKRHWRSSIQFIEEQEQERRDRLTRALSGDPATIAELRRLGVIAWEHRGRVVVGAL